MYEMPLWCEAGRHRGDVAKAVMAAKARVKDPDSARAMEADLLEANEYLELNAALGMATMLLVNMHPSVCVCAVPDLSGCPSRTHTCKVRMITCKGLYAFQAGLLVVT